MSAFTLGWTRDAKGVAGALKTGLPWFAQTCHAAHPASNSQTLASLFASNTSLSAFQPKQVHRCSVPLHLPPPAPPKPPSGLAPPRTLINSCCTLHTAPHMSLLFVQNSQLTCAPAARR